MNKREKLQRETRFHQRRRTPSFSSSLLDTIYGSFDESNAGDFHGDRRNHFREIPITVKRRDSGIDCLHDEEKEVNILNRDVAANRHFSGLYKSGSSSSDSSTGSAFSSSEAESSCRKKSKPKSTENGISDRGNSQKHRDGGFAKTKLRALKFYGELKKVKQPISPGGRISNFLTSIFNSGNVKKPKMCYAGAVEDVTISTASSLSRSCLTKSSSSRGKSSSANQKTVRFHPVSFILDEDSKPTSLKFPSREKERPFLKRFLQEEEDYDDCESWSSCDLFEIDLLVGIGRYEEELPVYETTNFTTNQAIANGFLPNMSGELVSNKKVESKCFSLEGTWPDLSK